MTEALKQLGKFFSWWLFLNLLVALPLAGILISVWLFSEGYWIRGTAMLAMTITGSLAAAFSVTEQP